MEGNLLDSQLVLTLAIGFGFLLGWVARQETMGLKNILNRKSNIKSNSKGLNQKNY